MTAMPTLPKPNEGGSFTPPPAGTFPAICYRIVDLGTQDTTYKGTPKRAHKVLISWEIRDDDAVTVDSETGEKRPMSVHQQYTWSMHEKAALRKALESWRGKKFVESDFGPDGFDIRKLLGVPCYIGIVHDERDGNTYANISAISMLPKGVDPGTLHNERQFLWLDEGLFDEDLFHKLSEKLQDKIKASPEYRAIANGGGEHVGDADEITGHLDDPIPF